MEIDLEIQEFLEGHNPMKYVVGIEPIKYKPAVHLIIHEPGKPAEIIEHDYKPFLFVKDLKSKASQFYWGDAAKKAAGIKKYGISIKKLRTDDFERLENGFKYCITSTLSFDSIVKFFRDGGLNVYGETDGNLFFRIKPEEQFMIQTGIRLFKGMEVYNDVHKLVFDIETTGLDPEEDRIFLIGLKDNRGFEQVLSINKPDDDESEKLIIFNLFKLINNVKPAIISGFYSEYFDFPFILRRAEILWGSYEIEDSDGGVTKNYIFYDKIREHANIDIRRDPKGSVKLGGETEQYTKTIMWGYNVTDFWHSVRRAKAINSDIKETGLKYITKFQGIAKPNRMYVEGDIIYKIWNDNYTYVINKENNSYNRIPLEYQDRLEEFIEIANNKELLEKESYFEYQSFYEEYCGKLSIITGKDIVVQYLLDDLWETQHVDDNFNQENFMLAKLTPVRYDRKCTMGNATIWNLLMTTWSYEKKLAIPYRIPEKLDFVGGLSRIFKIGFAKHIQKLDYDGLYPSIQLNGDIFPDFDITHVLKRILLHLKNGRSVFKKLASDETLSKSDRKFYKTKQLPLKVLNNANFGATGSQFFNWADINVAETTTCTGRQYLRLMIDFFSRYGCQAMVTDTDGCHYVIPETTLVDINGNMLVEPLPYNSLEYTNGKGETLIGIKAVLEKFNTEILKGDFMKLDDDGRWISCINVSKKNYANLEADGKIKITGNTIKSSTLPEYIEIFLDKALTLILQDKPKEFIEWYYEYLNKVFYNEIPLKQIASKAKVKRSIVDYVNRGYDKNGRLMPKQAFMELILAKYLPKELVQKINDRSLLDIVMPENEDEEMLLEEGNNEVLVAPVDTAIEKEKLILKQSLQEEARRKYNKYIKSLLEEIKPYNKVANKGDVVYFVNAGTTKSHGASKTDKEGNLMSELINADDLEKNPDMLGKYNVAKAVADFNTRVSKILIVFDPSLQETILKDVKIKRKNKIATLSLDEREFYTENDLKFTLTDKDTIDEIMTMEVGEIDFWVRMDRNPYEIFNGFKTENQINFEEFRTMFKKINDKIKPLKGVLKTQYNKQIRENDFVIQFKDNKYYLNQFKNNNLELVKELV